MNDRERSVWIAALGRALPREASRIQLRVWTHDDVDRCAALSGPGAPWRALNGPYFPQSDAEAVESARQRRHAHIDAGRNTGRGQMIVIASKTTDLFLGTVSWYWQCEHTRWPAAGIVLHDEATWGRGLGHEALGTWVGLLFELGQFHRLDLRTWSGNHGMMGLAEKLGFALEARFREARPVDGMRYDGLAYGILASEWAERHPDGFMPPSGLS